MANVIKSRTFSSIEDKRIQLSNANFARLWSSDVGTGWTTLRIGCRISMTDSGANVTSTPRFAFGICSGTSNIFMDATCTHWLGAITANTFRRVSAGPPAYYDLANNTGQPFYPATYIGTTLTLGSGLYGGSYNTFLFDSTTANRALMFLDITKGSPNFSLKMFSNAAPAGTQTATDVDLATYLTQVSLTSPSLTGHVMSNTQTIAVSEATNGFFNAVNISWDRSSPNIEISDLAVVKLV